MSNIISRFIEAAEKYPDTIAIIDGEDNITYAQLLQDVKQCAYQLQKKGLKKGDSMIIFIPMGIDLYRTVLACFYIGVIAVFVDEWVSLKRLELCCEIANCKGFAGTWKARLIRIISKKIRQIPLNFKYKRKPLILNLPEIVNPEDTALITFTTGSTGIPKAANRTHQFLEAQLDILIEELNPQPNDRSMPLLPVVLLINLSSGATSIIAPFKTNKPKNMKPEVILTEINRHKVKTFISSPFILLELAKTITNKKKNQHIPEQICTGGAPVFPNEAIQINKAFPASKTTVFYGSTESEPISSINTTDLAITTDEQMNIGLPVGKIHPLTETLILNKKCKDHQFESIEILKENCVNAYEVGEIIVSGPHVLKQYINNPTAEKLNKIKVDDKVWHRTGDSGYLDNKQTLFLTGRLQQIIKINGIALYPFIEEYKLKQLDGVNLGTILMVKNKCTVVIESIQNRDQKTLKSTIEAMYEFALPLVVFRDIPRDQRHFSKIDYGRLVKELDSI